MSHAGIGKGLNAKLLLASIGVSAAGLFCAYVGFFTNRGVRIGFIPIPLSIVGPALVLGGLVLAALSFRQLKCLQCAKPLDFASICLPLGTERQVSELIDGGDPRFLEATPMGSEQALHLQLSLDYCDHCKAIGVVDVDTYRPEHRALIEKRTVMGRSIGPLLSFMKAREEAQEAAES